MLFLPYKKHQINWNGKNTEETIETTSNVNFLIYLDLQVYS
jgi:hypothetical protein